MREGQVTNLISDQFASFLWPNRRFGPLAIRTNVDSDICQITITKKNIFLAEGAELEAENVQDNTNGERRSQLNQVGDVTAKG